MDRKRLKWIEKGKTNYSDIVAKFCTCRLRFDGCVHFLLCHAWRTSV